MRYFRLAIIGALCLIGSASSFGDDRKKTPPKKYTLYPIGHVKKEAGKTRIILDKRYQPGLLGLDRFSHIQVFYWFDRNDTPQERSILQVHPRGKKSNPLSGVFATRAPVRPNLIALSLCEIVSIRENIIEIDEIDAFPGTPVLDIKPYIPDIDAVDGDSP